MKRWVLLGLVGGLVACNKDSVEAQACPGTAEGWLQQGAGLSGETAGDGLEEVLITYKPRVSASAMNEKAREDVLASAATRAGAQVKHRFPRLNMVSARVTAAAREALARDPDVAFVEENRVVRAMGMPRLPASVWLGGAPNSSGSVGEYTPGLQMVQAPSVWDANSDGVLDTGAGSGTGIKVCVIDSGLDYTHPELKDAYIGGKDFIDNDDDPKDESLDVDLNPIRGGGHGTHTAGTIAAQLGGGGTVRQGTDPNGVAGVAPTASLLIARVLDVRGNGRTDDVIRAIEWCTAQGANIASLSLGAERESANERLAFQQAAQAGVLSFAATGNSGADKVSYPAAYPTVIAVGAVDFAGEWASFSQFGDQVSLVAPGVSVLSATLRGAAPFAGVSAQGTEIIASPLEYSGIGKYTGRLVNCGLGDSIEACGGDATCSGFVAVVERGGGIFFEEKARNSIRAGARAVIVVNNDAEDGAGNFTLTSPSANWVPTASVALDSGGALRSLIGREVTVDVSGSDYLIQSGTSMATPHAAGVAALVWSARRDLTAAQVRQALEKSAKDLGPALKDAKYGHGLVQAADAIKYANDTWPRPPAPLP
ncbi:S8 family serine peptidase [Pyxidicoccus xibeiensis]|uniref:S8 family serine peptidase n=1 Tax=Pyxidicoccus xibeiensis TaxID=2906759 RepID=UPI0020A78572|nr:S8 family serine peptidase [Pyxidicoccus xibeiensis]MCP3142926.1 S8 family serine peptidase [Pyxidicoccus xibeiensis]